MKTFWLIPLTVAAVAGLAGCGGGSDEPHNFAGRWAFTRTLSIHLGNWPESSGVVTIAQNERSISVEFPEGPADGLCNPDDGTFTAEQYTNGRVTVCSYVGHAESDAKMSGTANCFSSGGTWAMYNWSAQLIQR